MSMNFIGCVNRILREQGIIRGDTDALSTFSDTNHNSTSQIAQLAIQNELTELMSRGVLPYAFKLSGSITLVATQRSYSLPSDFTQFYGDDPYIYDSTSNYQIHQYPGGEQQLRKEIYTYRTDPGYPMFWYFEEGTVQKVSFYCVPDSARANLNLTFDYMGSVNVVNSTDTIPLTTDDQTYAFTTMAGRRFKWIYEGKPQQPIDEDPVYREAQARLFRLIKGKQLPRRYGNMYLSGQFFKSW